MLEYLVFAVCAIVFLVVTILSLIPGQRRHTTIPGPDVIDDLEGHYPDIQSSGSLHQFLKSLHDEYGSITAFNFGHTFCVSIASPELFKENAKAFDRPSVLFDIFEPLITDKSIQFANGAEGRQRHAVLSRPFSHKSVHMYMDIILDMSKHFCANWEGLANEEHIGLMQYTNAFAIKTIMAVAFGQYFQDDKRILEFKRCYDITWHEMDNQLKRDAPDVAREKAFDASKDRMYSMLQSALRQARAHQLPEADHNRFIDELIALDATDDVIKADMMTFAVGGFHTTGLLLTWSLYFLASHPDVQEKLFDELDMCLGEETITFEAIPQLKYMRQVLDETLRCSTIAPYAARMQEFDTELGGHQVPAGTPVVHALGVVLQDETLWPDPELFDPDRFEEEAIKSRHSYAFQPFGFAGGRKCPGYQLAYTEATVLLSEVIRKFKIFLVEGQVVQKEYSLVTKPIDEIWITLEKRK